MSDKMIAVVSTAYSLDGSTEDWLRRVAAVFVEAIDGAYGGAGHAYEVGEEGLQLETVRVSRTSALPANTDTALSIPLLRAWTSTPRLSFGSEVPLPPTRASALAGVDRLSRDHDVLLLVAPGSDSRGWLFGAAASRARRPSASQRLRWQSVAGHVANAGQVRRALATLPTSPVEPAAADLRSRLRAAVLDGTSAGSGSPPIDAEEPGRAWPSLAAGTWSLVDHFEADGRAFIVALPGTAATLDPQALTSREREIAEQTALGRSGKEIAYQLGLPAPTVSSVLHSALRKLRFESVAQLAAVVRRLRPSARKGVPPC